MKEILISIAFLIFLIVWIRKILNYHPRDKYHNDSWKDSRKKKRSRHDRFS